MCISLKHICVGGFKSKWALNLRGTGRLIHANFEKRNHFEEQKPTKHHSVDLKQTRANAQLYLEGCEQRIGEHVLKFVFAQIGHS